MLKESHETHTLRPELVLALDQWAKGVAAAPNPPSAKDALMYGAIHALRTRLESPRSVVDTFLIAVDRQSADVVEAIRYELRGGSVRIEDGAQ